MAAAARPLASASAALGASSRLVVPPSRLPRAAALALRGRRSFAAAAGGAVMGKAGALDADAGMDGHQRRLLFEDEGRMSSPESSPERLDWGSIEEEDGAFALFSGCPGSSNQAFEEGEIQPSKQAIEEGEIQGKGKEVRSLEGSTQGGSKKDQVPEESAGGGLAATAPRWIRSAVVKPSGHKVSYKDALVKKRTFKPRFPSNSSDHIKHGWLHEERRWTRKRASVWARLGVEQRSTEDRSGRTVSKEQPHWLPLLKAKAGNGCYNCLASDHHIAACRDPPRCILCLRFGHKARHCRRSRATPTPAPRSTKAAAAAAVASVNRQEHKNLKQLEPSTALPGNSLTACNLEPEFIPGDASRRPDHVTVCVPRSAAVREEERMLSLTALVGVQVDGRAKLTSQIVRRDALQQLRIPKQDLGVKRLTTSTFLIHFSTPEQRTATLKHGDIAAGTTALRLMPWTRQISASASKLLYRARVCIEGIPEHAQQIQTIARLFNATTFIEEIDNDGELEKERDCLCLWVWTSDPDGLAKTVTMNVAEPITFPEEHHYQMGEVELPTTRTGPAEMLNYEVIVHLDRVYDYSPLPDSSSHRSACSNISGLPDDSLEEEWPVKYRFVWDYGVPDDCIVRRRVPVHERLGGRRERSPPGRGGGRRPPQVPPPSWHEFKMAEQRGFNASSSSHREERKQYGRRHQAVAKEGSVMDYSTTGKGCQMMYSGFQCKGDRMGHNDSMGGPGKDANGTERPRKQAISDTAETCFLLGQNLQPADTVDPMRDEAFLLGAQLNKLCTPGGTTLTKEQNILDKDRKFQKTASMEQTINQQRVGQVLDSEQDEGNHCNINPDFEFRLEEQHNDLDSDVHHQPEQEKGDERPVVGEVAVNETQDAIVPPPEPEKPQEQFSQPAPQENTGRNLNGTIEAVAGQGTILGSAFMSEMTTPITKPIPKAILPASSVLLKKNRQGRGKENVASEMHRSVEATRKSNRLAEKPKSNLTIEEQATILLMRKCGTLEKGKEAAPGEKNKFPETFVEPIQKEVIADLRDTFGLKENLEDDPLGALALQGQA